MSSGSGQILRFPSRHGAPSERRRLALARFRAALCVLADDPCVENALQYLAASRAVDESKGLSLAMTQSVDELPPAA
jgi:hypothetical protein